MAIQSSYTVVPNQPPCDACGGLVAIPTVLARRSTGENLICIKCKKPAAPAPTTTGASAPSQLRLL